MTRPVALVTGASSGIGRALTVELATRGHDLILVARDRAALDALAADLRALHGATLGVTVVPADLADPAASDRIMADVTARRLTVDLLVHNAGFGVHGPFATTDLAAELAMVRVQIDAMLALTKAFLPAMRARRGGRILINSSVYSFSPVPCQAVYSACKAFLWNFAASLADELRTEGVGVTVLAPGSTRTAFRKRAGVREKKEGASGMTAEAVATQAVDAALAGRLLVVPGRLNQIFVTFARLLPAGCIAPLVRRINGARGVSH